MNCSVLPLNTVQHEVPDQLDLQNTTFSICTKQAFLVGYKTEKMYMPLLTFYFPALINASTFFYMHF